MPDKDLDGLLERIRSEYNPPPETPREEMWSVIQERIGKKEAEGEREGRGITREAQPGRASQWEAMHRDAPQGEATAEQENEGVVSLEKARQARKPRQPFVWAVGAAAILVLGLGIGRLTAPGAPSSADGRVDAGPASAKVTGSNLLRLAALDHLARTESMLTLARADASSGGLDAGVGQWSRGLLAQTRLIMDAQESPDPVLQQLLEDLEMVLVQLVGAAATDGDPLTIQSEWNLALEGLEDTEVLARIRAMLPTGTRFMGT